MLLLLGIFEQKFFCQPRLVPQTEEMVRINPMALGFQSLLQQSRERQVHIVATQQNVIADGHAPQRQIAALFRDRNQAEIRRASTNVAYQNQIADLDSLAPTIAALFRDRNQAEIRRASTNVAYQNQIADLDSLAP